MKKPPALAAHATGIVTVLSVDPIIEDHAVLEEIFSGSPWSLCPGCRWELKTSATLLSAWTVLHRYRIPIVLCEYDLSPGTWRELLWQLDSLSEPPYLIVASRRADESLWAEALNLGAYDVLAKPFDRTEVTRVVSLAWLHWKEQHGVIPEKRLARAGGSI